MVGATIAELGLKGLDVIRSVRGTQVEANSVTDHFRAKTLHLGHLIMESPIFIQNLVSSSLWKEQIPGIEKIAGIIGCVFNTVHTLFSFIKSASFVRSDSHPMIFSDVLLFLPSHSVRFSLHTWYVSIRYHKIEVLLHSEEMSGRVSKSSLHRLGAELR